MCLCVRWLVAAQRALPFGVLHNWLTGNAGRHVAIIVIFVYAQPPAVAGNDNNKIDGRTTFHTRNGHGRMNDSLHGRVGLLGIRRQHWLEL